MSYKVEATENFKKEAKKLIKKYKSLKGEIAQLGGQLTENPTLGIALGKNCYKIRLAIESKGKGKSGGARVITHVYVKGETVFLLSIYSKGDKDDISDAEIDALLEQLDEEDEDGDDKK